MTTGSDPSRDGAGSQDPYERLGIRQDASFEAVQIAKQARLRDVGSDPRAQALIEAAYDAVLMERLKERQQGKVSSAARTASQQETTPARPVAAAGGPMRQLPRLPSFSLPQTSLLPQIEPAAGRQLWVPLLVQVGVLLVLVASPSAPADLLLAFSTGVCVLAQVRRQRRLLPALGWSVVLLSSGLILGELLATVAAAGDGVPSMAVMPLGPEALRALPAWLLLLLGSLLLA
ncbi:hypothetical protein EVJ50_05900 [Synechococcus sp. RSCCF101]|uniref:CPP1-like family protein n=1 Tax=Synechococcus sp. RSCCF101 TaxID=2511069 RepID=UPI0012460A3A|nr:CPP1-like family protein [Synechococcus sp. RSCCF101]QEY31844.1 hypothetical protein EVJ50_05900 [Synechococcus sp. RSCCF101]